VTGAALLAATVAALLGTPAQAAPVAIALVSASPSAAASELARELETSGFFVVPFFPPGSASYDSVILTDDASSVRVLRRLPGSPPQVVATLPVDRDDDLARRRTWLAVVEQLRLPAPVPLPPAALAATSRTARAEARPAAFALGAATALELGGGAGQPTGHLQLSWLVPIGSGRAIAARALWPLVGAQLQTADSFVRMWTFGAAAGVQQLLDSPSGRLRPFLGATVGSRLLLADLNDLQGPSSRTRFTPTVAVAGQLGLRLQLRSHVDLFAETELGYAWMVASGDRTPVERTAAAARSLQVALGVLFGY